MRHSNPTVRGTQRDRRRRLRHRRRRACARGARSSGRSLDWHTRATDRDSTRITRRRSQRPARMARQEDPLASRAFGPDISPFSRRRAARHHHRHLRYRHTCARDPIPSGPVGPVQGDDRQARLPADAADWRRSRRRTSRCLPRVGARRERAERRSVRHLTCRVARHLRLSKGPTSARRRLG